MNKDYSYPRESVEYVYFKELSVHGTVPMIAEYAIARAAERPQVWAPLQRINNKFAFLLPGTLDPGRYRVYVRVPDAPETTVTEAGEIEIT